MNQRLEIAALIIQSLVMQEPDLLLHRPTALAHRALMIADILIACDATTSENTDNEGTSKTLH